MEKIKKGDQVKHKNNIFNGGVPMSVIDTSEQKANCIYFDSEYIDRERWFDFSELKIIHSHE